MIFTKCLWAKSFWEAMDIKGVLNRVENGNIKDWIHLCANNELSSDLLALFCLWRNRNLNVFEKRAFNPVKSLCVMLLRILRREGD